MSENAFSLIQEMDMEQLETQIALQCAPVIAGLKISNLLIVQEKYLETLQNMLKETQLSYEILLRRKGQITFLIYQETAVKNYLAQIKVKELLKKLGYASGTLKHLLKEVKKRYRFYMEMQRNFPHEMGLLLGYPPEDVQGFIENEGRNFLYAGYWKVYENLPAKLSLFQKYEQAGEAVLQMIALGVSVRDIINIYSENAPKQAALL